MNKRRLLTSSLALSAVLAGPVAADVTASDVWANQQAYLGALGIRANGTVADGMLMNPEFNIVFPMGVANFQVTADSLAFEENSDGSVTIRYPSPMTISLAGGVQGEGAFEVDFVMTHDEFAIVATGNPGDVTYVSQASNMRVDVGDVSYTEVPPEEFEVEGYLTIDSWATTTRVMEGDLITYESTSDVGRSFVDFTIGGQGLTSQTNQTTLPVRTEVVANLPAGGSDLMNLSGALRDGLNVFIESSGEGGFSEAVTLLEGEVFNAQNTSTGPQSTTLTFAEDGLKIAGAVSDIQMVMQDQLLFPGDIAFGMSEVSIDYDIPVNASDDVQDFRLALGLKGITLGDMLWDMFDPASQLPRDPAEISFDIIGEGTSGMDLLNFTAMMDMFGAPPVEINQVSIESMRIAVGGAEATAEGSMTFDWTDFETIPGFARPQGEVVVNLNGANRLMDALAEMGLIPAEELMMPRMMMGMFATPVGDDMLTTTFEVNEQGHVLANGQRLQ